MEQTVCKMSGARLEEAQRAAWVENPMLTWGVRWEEGGGNNETWQGHMEKGAG